MKERKNMTIIRPMQPADKEAVLAMMEVFYTSPAVFTNGSATIYSNDFEACVSDNPYLEGYMFEENGQIQGYAMTAKKLFYGIWPSLYLAGRHLYQRSFPGYWHRKPVS